MARARLWAELDMATAFGTLRRDARELDLRLSELAQAVVHRAVPAQVIVAHNTDRGRTPRCNEGLDVQVGG